MRFWPCFSKDRDRGIRPRTGHSAHEQSPKSFRTFTGGFARPDLPDPAPTASRRPAPDQNYGTMRSSKSRSRNKSRNQRTLGNIVNRVFDSSGPEGKVRGTPQQIIEKYLALARDAQLSGDRVAEQSFLQHAEHYTRMLGEAQREQAERQAQFGAAQGDDRQGDDRQNGERQNGERRDENRGEDRRRDDRGEGRDSRRDDNRAERRDDRRDRRDRDGQAEPADPSGHDALPDFLRAPARGIPEAVGVTDDPGPVETPEARAAESRLPEPEALPPAETDEAPRGAEGAEDEVPRARRRSTSPRRTGTPRKRGGGDAGGEEAPASDLPTGGDA